MKNTLYFIDVEATGLDYENDRLIQLAFLKVLNDEFEVFDDLCYTDIEMTEEVINIHKITNLMLKDKYWPYETNSFVELEKGNIKSNYFISHGNELDLKMLENEELKIVMKCIDTEKCTRHLLKETKSFKLENLINNNHLSEKSKIIAKKLGLTELNAHDAMSDALWHYVLFQFLLEKVNGDIDLLVELTETPFLMETIPFGKYKNKTFEEIFLKDPNDFIWMYVNIARDWEDLEYTLIHWLETKPKLLKRAENERKELIF